MAKTKPKSSTPTDWHLFGVTITGVTITVVLAALVMVVALAALA